MPKLISTRGNRTSPFIWLLAILLAILAVAVIITGMTIFVVYMIYKPKMPYIQVAYAHLDKLEYDQQGLLDTQMTLTIIAENDNLKADSDIDNCNLVLQFGSIILAELRAGPLHLLRNSTLPLTYIIPSSPVPLDEETMKAMDSALDKDVVPFRLEGQARTRWPVGHLLSLNIWTHLSCNLQFRYSNGSSVGLDCSSKSN